MYSGSSSGDGLRNTDASSRLDYCNSLLYGVSDNLIRRVQSVQNAAARLLTGAGRRDHISPVLRQLHWLPVQRRVDYKLACFVFSSLSGHAPPYLADDIHLVSESHRRRLRSSTDRSCAVPRIHNTLISATGASLLPGHVFGSVFPPTCVTRTLHTAVSGVNSKRFVASGVQWLFKNTLTYILTHFQFLLTTQVHQMET